MHLHLILHLSYQGFQSWKEPALQHPHYPFVQKTSQHCCWKCSAHEVVVFIDCIFTSPKANQSHLLPNASLSFALVAFYSNSSFPARRSSPLHLPCNGVQHSWNATQWWEWACMSVETWISPRQVCGKLVLIPLLHCPFSFTSVGGLSASVATWLATRRSKLCSLEQPTLQLQEQQCGY